MERGLPAPRGQRPDHDDAGLEARAPARNRPQSDIDKKLSMWRFKLPILHFGQRLIPKARAIRPASSGMSWKPENACACGPQAMRGTKMAV